MFCENCGKPNDDNARFCEHCGAAFSQTPPVNPAAVPPIAARPKEPLVKRIKQIHDKNKWLFPGAAAVIALIILACVVFSILGKQVPVSDYLNVEVSGYDGYGQLTYDFDELSFVMRVIGLKEYKEYGDADLEDEEFVDVMEEHKRKIEKLEKLITSIKITAELPEGRTKTTLKNGDIIIVTVNMDESQAEKLDVSLKNMTIEYTVSGLKDTLTYSPLENFNLVFDGYNGYGSYELVCTKTEEKDLGDLIFTTTEGESVIHILNKENEYTNSIYVYTEGDNNRLSNGDTIRMYITTEENRWISDGVMLAGISKEVAVSGLAPMQTIDLLTNIQVHYEGINGDGDASLSYIEQVLTVGELTFDFKEKDVYIGEEYLTSFSFSFSNRRDLTNGDQITLETSVNEDRLAKYGVAVSQLSKEMTVSNLAAYAGDMDSIRESLATVTELAKTELMDWLYDSWNRAVHDSFFGNPSNQEIIAEPILHKAVLTTSKSSSSSTKNTLWLVFKGTLNDSKLETPTELYFALCLDNVAVKADGSLYLTDEYFDKYSAEPSYEEIYTNYIEEYNVNIYE